MLNLFKTRPVFVVPVRYFAPKEQPQDTGTYRGEKIIRYGYEAHHHTNGLLPRLKIKERRLGTIPYTTKENLWSSRLRRQGENDFVKILGDEEIEQHELLTHVPDWLRGYKGMGKEYSVLMRKRKEFDYWRYSKPLKWQHLEKRISFLYKMINNKYKPPDVEKLSRSRYSA